MKIYVWVPRGSVGSQSGRNLCKTFAEKYVRTRNTCLVRSDHTFPQHCLLIDLGALETCVLRTQGHSELVVFVHRLIKNIHSRT